jgi:predicted aconitase with swiveling domain
MQTTHTKASLIIFDGECRAETLVLEEPLSFWGGLDPQTGRIIDERHPQQGASVTGRILMLPGTRGSTSSPGALCESLRLGTGPAGIVLPAPNVTILTAVTVAAELYQCSIPVLVVEPPEWDGLSLFKEIHITLKGILNGFPRQS